jgi:hypothetical protein
MQLNGRLNEVLQVEKTRRRLEHFPNKLVKTDFRQVLLPILQMLIEF